MAQQVIVKMALVFSAPGRPRGRGRIERFFQTVDQLFLSGLPGYTPHGAARPTPTLTLPELDQRLKRFFLADYHHRVHGETGMPPQERWEAGGFLPHLPESLEQLDLLHRALLWPTRGRENALRAAVCPLGRLGAAFATRRVTLDPLGIPKLTGCRTVSYTPSMTTTPKRLSDELHQLRWSLPYIVEDALHAEEDQTSPGHQ